MVVGVRFEWKPNETSSWAQMNGHHQQICDAHFFLYSVSFCRGWYVYWLRIWYPFIPHTRRNTFTRSIFQNGLWKDKDLYFFNVYDHDVLFCHFEYEFLLRMPSQFILTKGHQLETRSSLTDFVKTTASTTIKQNTQPTIYQFILVHCIQTWIETNKNVTNLIAFAEPN